MKNLFPYLLHGFIGSIMYLLRSNVTSDIPVVLSGGVCDLIQSGNRADDRWHCGMLPGEKTS